MAVRRALTDAAAWAIVCGPCTDAETLGRRLGISASTIRNARARFRRRGWSCRVAYVACRHCGGLLVQRGHRAGRAAYHERCLPEARRRMQRRLDGARWERMTDTERDRILAKARDADDEHQARTLAQAVNAGSRWSAEDDAYLVQHWNRPAHEVALALGRSLRAVRGRRVVLRKRGMPDGLADPRRAPYRSAYAGGTMTP